MRSTSAIGRAVRGYSLLELMVVMTIIVLIAGSIPFAMNRLVPARRLATATNRLLADTKALQAYALASGAPSRLIMQADGYSMTVRDQSRDRVELSGATKLAMRGIDGNSLQELTFFPDGTSSGARILLTDSGNSAEVAIAIATGHGRVKRKARS